jgi:hypothetical protein
VGGDGRGKTVLASSCNDPWASDGRRREGAPKRADKSDFPVSRIERDLEPGPIVLVTSALFDGRNIMG